MFPSDASIMQFFAQYAHSPFLIYTIVSAMMLLASFGLPLPEEVTIVSLGLLVHMGANPAKYPPPVGVEYSPLNVYTAMIVCFLAVIISDSIVFYLGKKFGDSPIFQKLFKRYLGENSLEKSRVMVHKHRFIVPAIFRFTPGIRFPGHLSCGMMGISFWTFLLTDGVAALLSVPTQVYLFSHYGEVILSTMKEVKYYFFIIALASLAIYLSIKLKQKYFGKKVPVSVDQV
jgi:membrane protein DedA with SNARE-associated domain